MFMSKPVAASDQSCGYFQPIIEPVVSWIRSAENAPLEQKISIYIITFFLVLVLGGTILGIPLLYLGLKEYGRQEGEARGITHPLTEGIVKFENACLFIKRFFQNPAQVSSIIPSSAELCAKIVSRINPEGPPKTCLEVGAGSGAFTHEIVKNLRPEDRLHIVEIDPEFCEALRETFKGHPNITVYQQSITDFAPGIQYDAIVSGLPIHGLPAAVVEPALKNYVALVRPGGTISHFEYIGLPQLKQAFLCGESRVDFDRVLACKNAMIARFGPQPEDVWCNFPPARVLHFHMPAVRENDGSVDI
jgi:phosphatidylethanolamine/phosphatidyl-N-methylethanolamine N-methyltransferase